MKTAYGPPGQMTWAPSPGPADEILWLEFGKLMRVQELGGFRKAVTGDSRFPSWERMPQDGTPFHYHGAIDLPANDGQDYTVLSFTVPQDHNAVISGFFHSYTGHGFVQGSGDLVWRLRIGAALVKNFEAMTIALGEPHSPYQISRAGILAGKRMRVSYIVSHSASSTLLGGRIVCGLTGWFYPTK